MNPVDLELAIDSLLWLSPDDIVFIHFNTDKSESQDKTTTEDSKSFEEVVESPQENSTSGDQNSATTLENRPEMSMSANPVKPPAITEVELEQDKDSTVVENPEPATENTVENPHSLTGVDNSISAEDMEPREVCYLHYIVCALLFFMPLVIINHHQPCRY